ncbi:hypothetical protein BH11PLA1_BH11PLA1_04560 [soil metagenome]
MIPSDPSGTTGAPATLEPAAQPVPALGGMNSRAGALNFTLTLVGFVLAVAPLLARACATLVQLPGWETDPLIDASPVVGVTPAFSMTLDAVSMSGSILLACAAPCGERARARHAVDFVVLVVFAACAAVLLYHAHFAPGSDLQQARVAAAWLSALTLGVVAWYSGKTSAVQHLTLATFLGFAALLVCKGIVQVFIEHPALLKSLRDSSDVFFRAQGWEADSPMARAYLRRAEQAEASGWFGLSNVYSSLCAAALAAAAALALPLRHEEQFTGRVESRDEELSSAQLFIRRRVPFIGVALAAAIGVALGGGKGGVAAAVFGLMCVLVFWLLQRRVEAAQGPQSPPRRGRVVATALAMVAIAAPLAAVAVRGFVGLRIPELSILFRAWYAEAALRIFADHPVVGVGPDGFKDAYITARNALSPEEVASPHSTMLDWTACLGFAGIGLALIWIIWLIAAARSAASSQSTELCTLARAPAERSEIVQREELLEITSLRVAHSSSRAVWLTAAAAVTMAMYVERAGLNISGAVVLVVGLVLFCAVASAVLSVVRTAVVSSRIALATAALTLALQGEIEVTASWVQSAGLFLLICGVAASGWGFPSPLVVPRAGADLQPGLQASERGHVFSSVRVFGVGAASVSALLIVLCVIPAFTYEAALTESAANSRPLAEARLIVRAVQQGRIPDPVEREGALREAAESLAAMTGQPPATDPQAVLAAAASVEPMVIIEAIAALNAAQARASGARLADWRIEREIKRLSLQLVALRLRGAPVPPGGKSIPDLARDAFFFAVPPLSDSTSSPAGRGRASRLAWDATAAESIRALGLTDTVTEADYLARLDAALRADAVNTPMHLRRVRFLRDHPSASAGQPQRLAAAVAAALQADENMRLDREIRGYTEAQRREVSAAALAPAVSPAR